MTWREMHDFTEGSVLVVLASELYTETDYIRNYEDFVKTTTTIHPAELNPIC
jgi:hypothetical protein